MELYNFDGIELERVEPYSWGKRDNPIVLVVNYKTTDSMLCIGSTYKGHEGMFKLASEEDDICRVTGNLVGDVIYWDIFCLRNMFKEHLKPAVLKQILEEYKNFTHKCY